MCIGALNAKTWHQAELELGNICREVGGGLTVLYSLHCNGSEVHACALFCKRLAESASEYITDGVHCF